MGKEDYNELDIFKSVKSEAINELTPEILDASIDLLTKSEVLSEIPVFGIGFKGYSLFRKVNDTFFIRKLLKFLFELKDIPLEERAKFIEKLESKDDLNKAGEKLLFSLNRLNDIEKAVIVGKLFKETILGNIERKDFNRLVHIIENAYIDDLIILKNNFYLSYVDDDVKINLYQIGLLKQNISDVKREHKNTARRTMRNDGIIVQPKLVYEINRICRVLIKYGF